MKYNLGSGDRRAPEPWINIDVQPSTKPDIVADVRSLPIPNGVADCVYLGHILEHVPLEEVPAVLRDVWRIMKLGGALCVVGPDYDRALTEPDPAEREILCGLIAAGGARWDGDRHHWTATETNTLAMVRDVFPNAAPLPIAEVPTGWPTDWPVDTRSAWWQFAIVATKESNA